MRFAFGFSFFAIVFILPSTSRIEAYMSANTSGIEHEDLPYYAAIDRGRKLREGAVSLSLVGGSIAILSEIDLPRGAPCVY